MRRSCSYRCFLVTDSRRLSGFKEMDAEACHCGESGNGERETNAKAAMRESLVLDVFRFPFSVFRSPSPPCLRALLLPCSPAPLLPVPCCPLSPVPCPLSPVPCSPSSLRGHTLLQPVLAQLLDQGGALHVQQSGGVGHHATGDVERLTDQPHFDVGQVVLEIQAMGRQQAL